MEIHITGEFWLYSILTLLVGAAIWDEWEMLKHSFRRKYLQ